MASPPLRCVLIGGDTLLTACGDVLLAAGHAIAGVVSDAERVVEWSRGNGLAEIDPASAYATTLRAEPFDYLFSIANLSLVPADVLLCARKGAVNFHEGPVPEYAGVNTPVWAIVNGETSWAITWHVMTAKLDAGDILLRKTFAIAPGETTVSLNTKCFAAALDTFPALVDALASGRAVGRPQGATGRYYGKHQRLTATAVIDWSAPASATAALVRALDFGRYLNPMAAPQVLRGSEALIVTRAQAQEAVDGAACGTVLALDGHGIDVAAGAGVVRLLAFTTQTGHDVAPAEAARRLGLAPGVRLDGLAPADRDRLQALTPALSKAEPFWARRLVALEPLELPYTSSRAEAASGARGGPGALPIELPAAFRARFADDPTAAVVAAYGVYLARLARKPRFDLALADGRWRRELAGLGAVIATEVPLALAIDPAARFATVLTQMKAELDAVRGKTPYLRDLVGRHPDLRRRATLAGRRLLPVGVSIDVEGSAAEREAAGILTLAVSNGGQTATLLYDPASLTDEAAQALAGQLGVLLAAFAADPERLIAEVELAAGVERASAFWKGFLSGFATATTLPAAWSTSLPSSAAGSDSASRNLRLSRPATEALRSLAAEHDVGVHDCVHAAWAALLAIHGGEPDVVFGVTAGGSAIPLRVLVDEAAPLTTWLVDLRARHAAMLPFADTPLADVQAWSERSPAPLFETVVAFADGGAAAPLAAIDVPLALLAQDAPEVALACTLRYSRARFDAEAIDRIADHFLALLQAMAANPTQRVGELPRVSEPEKHQLLVEWNDTAVDFPRTSIHRAIEEQVARTPDATAVVYRDRTLSYAELNHRANRVAHDLRARGVGPDVMVGIFVERGLEMVIGLLGILKAGGAYVPMDPLYPPDRLAMMLEDSRAPVILTLERLRRSLPPGPAQVIALDAPPRPTAEDNPIELSRPEDLAYVIFTSGSTGRPKGVQIEHRNVINFFAGMDACLGHDLPGVWLAVTSISFDISVLELLWTLSRGFKVVLQEEADRAPVVSSARGGLDAKGIEFSLFYFAADAGDAPGNKYRLLLEGAKYADKNGFAAIWTPERHFHAFGGLYPNPALTSAAIAVLTERIEIRAGSVVLPLHNPIRAAEEWAVVDNLSGGRVGLSFASGWHAADFALAPDNYADRRKLMAQGIETVRALWRGEAVPAKSGDGKDIRVKIFPAPIQREPRIWVTASSSAETFALAGKTGASILTNLLSMKMEELVSNIGVYRAAWKDAGHRGPGHITLMLHTFVGRDLEEVKRKVRGPFLEYLKSSTDLISKARWEQSMFARPDKQRGPGPQTGPAAQALDLADLTREEMDAMMAHAFERYFKTAGLFGTPASCLETAQRLRAIGVDEIACLIDFGVDATSVLESLTHLNQLRKQCLPREAEGREDYSVPAQIRRHGVTHLQCTPSMARILASDGDALESLRPLRKLLLGGEALPDGLAAELGQAVSGEILNMYGPTETTVWSTTARVPKGAGRITIGRPIANTQIYVVDRFLRPCPIGVPGEVLIGGSGVVRGYLGRPELTAEKFIASPFAADPTARLYRTGDLGRWLPDGTIDFVGRIDHQVKIRGYRIELGEIEAVVGKHPGVRACAVVVREDTPGDQRIVAHVVPRHGSPSDTAARDTTSDWQKIWDETYLHARTADADPAEPAPDPTFNIAGWNSSFDGAPIPAREMRDWVDRTTERILALAPKRVLEIGCGTGLYLFRVAPHCERYCGVDFSPRALEHIASQLGTLNLPQVSLREAAADDFSGLEPGAFDTVIISSVIQYFPSVDYLLKVIEQALVILAPGGRLFIGDVRSLLLLELFATAIELHQAADAMPLDELKRRIERRVADERELVIDPAFFHALRDALPDVGGVSIDLKRGAFANELTRFRYDVVVHKGEPDTTQVRRGDYDAAAQPELTASAIAPMLAGAPSAFVVTNVLNRHVVREHKASELLRAGALETVADLRAALAGPDGGLAPEDFVAMAPDYDVEVTWADSGAIECFDVTFRHKHKPAAVTRPVAATAPRKPWPAYANHPAKRVDRGHLLSELRAHLKEKLPAFMVPTAFVVLDALPLTPNGKINRKALPAPDRTRQESAASYQAPTLELERMIASVWQDLLSLDQVSTVDNLFDLGANSLLMVQANGRLRAALGQELSLVDMFEYPTVKSLAAFLGQQDKGGAADTTLQESQERGQSRRHALQRRRELRPGTRNH